MSGKNKHAAATMQVQVRTIWVNSQQRYVNADKVKAANSGVVGYE